MAIGLPLDDPHALILGPETTSTTRIKHSSASFRDLRAEIRAFNYVYVEVAWLAVGVL